VKLAAPIALGLACTLLASGVHAQPAAAKLVPAQSEITFQLKQSGVPVDGKFKRFDAQLALDPKAPQGGSVTVSIDTGSASVGFAETDAEPLVPVVEAKPQRRQRQVDHRQTDEEGDDDQHGEQPMQHDRDAAVGGCEVGGGRSRCIIHSSARDVAQRGDGASAAARF